MSDSAPTPHVVHVAVHTPMHSTVGGPLSYTHPSPLPPGTLVRVRLGTRPLLGVVWEAPQDAEPVPAHVQLRALDAVLPLPPLDATWLRLVAFAARYYQRSLGEIAMAGLPPALRSATPEQLAKRLQPPAPKKPPRKSARAAAEAAVEPVAALPAPPEAAVTLSAEQRDVVDQIAQHPGPFLLYGSTGSGKTEVYLRVVQRALEANPQAQALVMVPEINLTPQLQERFATRFAPLFGPQSVVSMHSGMTEVQRLKSWLAAHQGQARILLGTRMAVFASLPGLKVIVVDEEHDPSYKQEEGARYSARDLALWRGHASGAQVLLGSATPSLESWHASDPAVGRYLRLHMPSRIGAGALPRVRLVDMRQQPKRTVFAPPLLEAITARVQRGEQSLVLLNRRGFAPVLFCTDCGWKSDCPHCSAHQVFHKGDRSLRCHHCGHTQRVPPACPSCGNPDILPLGKGTEQLEEELARLLRNVQRPDGQPARVGRIDADTTRHKGALEAQLAQVHEGEIDVLVGTQMVAKGHDFRRITLVAAVQPDGALFSSDFRAPERLFCLLMQAAGRAGRDAGYVSDQGSQPEMWVQTAEPQHSVFTALRQHDYPAFAARQLQERHDAGMPPFAFQALVRADAKTQDAAQAFLRAATDAAHQGQLPRLDDVFLYSPIPMSVQRVANVERAQMLIEATDRRALQRFLHAWQPWLHWVRSQPQHKGVVRWLMDVDPLSL
ncbi:replication restart helicase PriA [Comamonas aquatica]|uniref:replication restart helicase PriA n=2 Tax=Comamonas aquatica TaxID=225991 RepID=UPI002446BFA2|nr:primosomal protein N' [Comamonas aquatica]MDH0200008.1 primosomal protein N' [Comamonas aquatica]MDH1444712.1 primosomal protein N' [Comamonas aquatica]